MNECDDLAALLPGSADWRPGGTGVCNGAVHFRDRGSVAQQSAVVEGQTDPSFDTSGSDLRSLMEEITAFAVEFVDGLGASRTATEEHARQIADRFVEAEPASASLRELLAALEDAAAVGFNPLHPGFLGYVPPTGLPISAIADFVAAILGRYVGCIGRHRHSPRSS